MKRFLLLVLMLVSIVTTVGNRQATAFMLDVNTVNFVPHDTETGVAISYPTSLQFVFTNPVDLAALHNDVRPDTGWRITFVEEATGAVVIHPFQDT